MTAGATYTPIQTQTVSGSSTTTVTFLSIPQTYTDLIISCNASVASGSITFYAQYNSDTSTSYSWIRLFGNGTSTASDGAGSPNYTYVRPGEVSSTWAYQQLNIMNYANTTTNKTTLWKNMNTDTTNTAGVDIGVSLWRNTSAINRVDIKVTGSNLVAGSTFTLYGIASA